MPSFVRPRRAASALLAACAVASFAVPALAATPRVHALVHARIVPAPGQSIEHGTIVIRDGLIVAVGADVPVPADARVWDAESLTVYPGLIDAHVMVNDGAPAPGPRRPGAPAASEPVRGASSAQPAVRADARAIENFAWPREQLEGLRAAGFTVAQVEPRRGVLRGASAVLALGDGPAGPRVLAGDAAQVVALSPLPQGYPGSLMGAIAVIRQAFMDAKWYRDANAAYARKPTSAQRPVTDDALAALQGAIAGTMPVQFVTDDMLSLLRAAAIAREAGVTARLVGAGDEYKRVREIAATGLPLVVPVHFPDAPDVSGADAAVDVSLVELRGWQDAPGNPAALARAGATFALTASGLKDPKTFAPNVARAIARGWSADAALAAVTTVPAKLLGLDARLGTIAPGRIANLTVTRGALFAGGQVREVWVDGDRYEAAKDATSPVGTWSIDWGHGPHALAIATDKDTAATLVVGADTLRARDVRLGAHDVRFTVQRGAEPAEAFVLAAANDALTGTLVVAGVGAHVVHGTPARRDAPPAPAETLVNATAAMGDPEPWRAPAPFAPAALLVRHATVWTAGPQGTLADADLLVKDGRIVAVGRGLAAPAGATVIDATGRHVAPGVIDEHSHAAISGNVNECTNSVTCEVRIGDVINSESPNLYRQLAGGVTVMHLLHGSCNAIGGQCAVIRDTWGASPDRLFFAGAPPTVKFALGENPKQSNAEVGDAPDRYPHTRAGVEQTIRDAFLEAQDYDRVWQDWRAGRRAIPPRRDLQLDALSEIVHGVRLVHCHSYRADEILMLMRLSESFGFRVNTFTHVLEGYKVADEMAAHGASGIGFTDWWQYKQEVIDGIPWNAWLMWDRGVNVGFNSDSEELARRLNTEAAKAVKYGGMPEEEAIKTVTIRPARSLGIDARVGSLEPGKDADFAIWSGSPLSAYSTCEQTWIQGRRYFDREADLAARPAYAQERAGLIAHARAARSGAPAGAVARRLPPRYLEDADNSGNECGEHQGHQSEFLSETARRARLAGEEVSR